MARRIAALFGAQSLVPISIATVFLGAIFWLRGPDLGGGEEWASCFPSAVDAKRTATNKDEALEQLHTRLVQKQETVAQEKRQLRKLREHPEWGVEQHGVGLGVAALASRMKVEESEREILETGDTMGCLEDL